VVRCLPSGVVMPLLPGGDGTVAGRAARVRTGGFRPGVAGDTGGGSAGRFAYLPVMNSSMDSGRFTMRTSPIQPWKTWSMLPPYS
jgi:hypothetical protein